MAVKCLDFREKISATNQRNLICKVCKKFCHPKCVKYLPPICVERCGNFRSKIVRNKKWICEPCILAELPFYGIPKSQITALIPRFILPSPDVLNDNFVNENIENESDDDMELTCFSSKTKYLYSKDIGQLNFDDEPESFESFPIVSLNVRSIVNKDNFTKFQSFLQNLSVRPMVIVLNET